MTQLSVIIIDDEMDICFLLGKILQQEKYHVRFAHSLNEGKRIVNEQRPDLVFLDNHLPDGTGISYLPDLRNKYPDCRIVMISAYDSANEKALAIEQGANFFVGKPFTSSEIQTLLRTLDQNS